MAGRIAGAVLIIAGALVGLAPPAAAAPSWSILSTQNQTASTGSLAGVACGSATSCMAVGSFTNGYVTKSFAERWNGSAWSLTSVPNPAGATESHLKAVACADASNCVAVGAYTNGAGLSLTLVEQWNGSVWSPIASPSPGANFNELTGVACPTGTFCVAVGLYVDGGPTTMLAEHFNGSTWSTVSIPAPGTATDTVFHGVACASTTVCFAVGHYNVGFTSSHRLVERWNGATWTVVSTPSPAGETGSVFWGAACPSTTSCFAVGTYNLKTLVERWNGSSWSITTSPNVGGASRTDLFAVSCASPTVCVAVGNADVSKNTVAERWNGSAWSLSTTPNPPNANAPFGSVLNGAACSSTTNCFAAGTYDSPSHTPKVLVERWSGSTWAISSTPSPSGVTENSLSSISCPAGTSNCFAVGKYTSATGNPKTLAEKWNGTAWSMMSIPSPGYNPNLAGISCGGPTSCMAVGDSEGEALVERWNGTTWSVMANVKPPGTFDSHLMGVWCRTATACFAVGSYAPPSSANRTLVERWNGTSWSVSTSPNPAGAAAGASLAAVTCRSATDCTAVGSYRNASFVTKTLVEHWNGSAWSIVSSPNPGGSETTELLGVSCTSATSCVAVGDHRTNTSLWKPLIERWNGASWTIATSPAFTGQANLTAVACASASECVAVGRATGFPTTFAERWDGANWSISPTPNPAGAFVGEFSGVSCRAGLPCFAVGRVSKAPSYQTLAERLK